jgi:integrase
MRLAYASSTKKTYRCQINAYLRFCLYFDRTHVPADQSTLKAYVAFLARSLNPSSIPGYLNVVRILHVQSGYDNPLEGNWELSMVKKGVSRKLGRPPAQKLPITLDILRAMYVILDLSLLSDIAFWAACLVCFNGLFRKSTLLPKSASDSSDCCLARSDVIDVSSDRFSLRVRHSKTNQFGQRELVIPFSACTDSRLCPLRFILLHLTGSKLSDDSCLFNYVQKGRMVCLTHTLFVNKLQKCLKKLGFDSSLYSGHSFRRGGCTMCYQAGLNLSEIKLRGDWRSQAFERYLYISPESIF